MNNTLNVLIKLASRVPPPQQRILHGYLRELLSDPGFPNPFTVLALKILYPGHSLPLGPGQTKIAGSLTF